MKEEDVVDAIKKNHKLKFMETVNQGDWRCNYGTERFQIKRVV